MKRLMILFAILIGFAVTSDTASAWRGRRAFYRGYYRPYAYRPYAYSYGPGYYYGNYRPFYYPGYYGY